MHPSWQKALKEEKEKPYFIQLLSFLDQEQRKHTLYPSKDKIFYAFEKTPFDQVKVVLLGQDPYHGPNQAHGLAFSVPHGTQAPPSLKNIYKELQSDLGIEPPSHGCLESWAEQGVLLLNTVLTVRAGAAASHAGQGWETFTARCLELLLAEERPLIFLLWGQFAQKRIPSVPSRHLILRAAHPSPLSAYNGFFGCKHFSKINQELTRLKKEPIDWRLQ